MNTMTAGFVFVYYHSVKGGVTLLWPFLMHFEQHVRNQKYYTPVGEGRKVDMVLELEKEMQQHGSKNRPE